MVRTKRPLYEGKDVTAADLRRVASVRGLSQEIALVRARLDKRLRSGRATDRFIQEQLMMLARLVVAENRTLGPDAEERLAEAIRVAVSGPLADVLGLAALGVEDGDGAVEGT